MKLDSAIGTSDKRILWILYVFLLSEALSGPIRYFLVNISMGWVVYVPKFILLMMIIYKIFQGILLKRFEGVFLIALCLIALQMCIGFLFVKKAAQVIFGIWVLIPLIFGLANYHIILRNWSRISYKPLLLLWLIAIVGVFLQSLMPFPWEGLQYSFAGVNVLGNKLWWISGIQRLSGFSRSSTHVAAEIVLIGLLLISKIRSLKWDLAIMACSMAALWFTSSRTWSLTWIISINMMMLDRYMSIKIKRVLPLMLALAGLGLPVSSFFLTPQLESKTFFSSLGERMASTWPRAFELVFRHGNIFLGRGIGGLGTPQNYYEKILYNSGDNLFISAYVLFGVLGIVILLSFVTQLGNALITNSSSEIRIVYLLSLTLLLHGLTANGLESPFDAVALGISLGLVFSRFFLSKRRNVFNGTNGFWEQDNTSKTFLARKQSSS